MLGHKVVERLLATDAEVRWTLRGATQDRALDPVPYLRGDGAIPGADFMQLEGLRRLLLDVRPDVVVNCAGVIKQRADAQAAIPAITINALLPHHLIHLLGEWGGRLIHVSTDCVFSGRRGTYTEGDLPDAEDLYGQTKALGEVREGRALTLRTSIIGRELRHHQSLLDWFLAQRGKRIRGFTRALWSGVTTQYLASLIAALISGKPELAGLYQVSSGTISKYDLLLALRQAYSLNVEIDPDDSVVCDRSLVGARFEAAPGYAIPRLPELISAMAADPTPYHALV